MLRLMRIALLLTVSFVAGASISGCSDDTTNTNPSDMTAATSTDMAHDLATHD